MKKFTKFWRLMMVLLVSSSIVFGQASDRKNAEKITKTDPTNSVFNVEVNNLIQNGDKELVTEFINKSKVNEWKKVTINLKGKGVAYAYVAYDPTSVLPQGPAYFDTDDPGTITSLAPTTSGDFIAGGTWADGVWYGVEYGTGNLYSIDETNGDMNLIGTAANMNGIAYDGTTMYGASSTDFYTIDISTGAATYVGSMGSGGGVMIALACDNSGTIYGIDLGDDNLYTIDPATGAATVVGPLGININYAQDAEYDKDNDVLYLAGYTASGELYTIDPATGTATYVGGFQGGCEMTAFAIPYVGYNIDIGIQSIVSPVTGPDLTNSEPVTVIVKNYGAVAQSGFDVYYTIDGGGQVTETISATINGGESYEYTFTQTADLSAYGTYLIEACTDLTGDENPNNDCKDVSVQNYDPSTQCGFSVVLWDDYGDGWNNGTLTISVGGTVVLDNITVVSGFGPETFYFDVINGADVTCVFTPGGWPYECSYYIYDNDENEVFSDGVGGVDPTGGTFTGVCIQFIYGDLAGTVTELATGNPIEGAEILISDKSTTTASDGTYLIELVMIGTWDVYCNAEGYNPEVATGVVILEEQTTTQDFALTSPTMDIDPLSIEVTLDPFATTTEYIDITNNGNGTLNWNAQIVYPEGKGVGTGLTGLTKDVIASEEALKADVIATGTIVPIDQLINSDVLKQATYKQLMGNGEFDPTDGTDTIGGTQNSWQNGPRTRGNLFTCTEEKLLVEFLGYHDILSDPTQMWMLVYEGASQVGIYDLVVAVDITSPPVGLGWVSSGEVNYMLQPGKYYMIVASFEQLTGYYANTAVTPFPYPVAFGEATAGAGWDYAPTSVFPPDVTQDVPAFAFADPTLYYQQLISADPVTWLAIDPTSGDVDPGNTGIMDVLFDATDILPGTILEADIHFTSDPNVGEVDVHVTLIVGDQEVGYIEGNVLLDGIAPYNIGDVEEVVVTAGVYFASPDASGDYSITVYPGTYDVVGTLYGYADATVTGVVVAEGQTVSGIDLAMDCLYGLFTGTVSDLDSGDPVEGAEVVVEGTDFSDMTNADGEYEILIEAGTYDLTADHATYLPETVTDVALGAQTTETIDFELQFQLQYCDASGGCDEFIDGVEFGDINNMGTGCGEYQDFTSLSTLCVPGETYTLTWYTGNMWTSDDYGIWIDFNQDGDFYDTGENVICVIDAGQDVYYFDITIPGDAVEGPTRMRLRLKWSGSDCGDPCGTTSYGEVEDYTVIIGQAIYGSLIGFVTELSSGDPIEDATVSSGNWTTTTDSDGFYEFVEILVGEYEFTATADGYNPSDEATVEIFEDQTTTQDFELTAPTMEVDPLEIYVGLYTNETATETITIDNNGNGPLAWSASIIEDGKGSQPTYPPYQEVIGELELTRVKAENSSGLAPSAAPNAPVYMENKYGPESTAYAYMAYDPGGVIPNGPIYFTLDDPANLTPFGGAASDFVATADWVNDVWYGVIYGGTFITIDMDDGTMTTIGSCPDLSGMAYDWTTETMYGVDFAGTLWTIDLATGTGTQVAATQPNLITMVCTNEGILYGFDLSTDSFGMIDKTSGTWIEIAGVGFDFSYAQDACVDHETNTIYWACYDVSLGGELLTVDAATGAVSFIGAFPNGAEVTGFAIPGAVETWIGIDPHSGIVVAGGSGEIEVFLDATDVAPGTILEADVHIVSDPDVGVVDVHVIMDVLTGIDEVMVEGLSIYPNPATDLVNINSDFNISTLKVYNFTGKVVFEGEINATQTQINTSGYEAGVYLLQIFTDNGTLNRNVIIK